MTHQHWLALCHAPNNCTHFSHHTLCVCVKYLHPLSCVFSSCKGTAVYCLASINKNEWVVHTHDLFSFQLPWFPDMKVFFFFFFVVIITLIIVRTCRDTEPLFSFSPSDTWILFNNSTYNAPLSDTKAACESRRRYSQTRPPHNDWQRPLLYI